MSVCRIQDPIVYHEPEEESGCDSFITVSERMILDDKVEQHRGFLLDGRVQVLAVPGLINLSNRTMEGLVFLVSEQVAAPEFGLEATDNFHRIVVSGMEVFLSRCPYSQVLVVITIQGVQGISIVLDHIEDGSNLIVCRGVQVSHRAAHNFHKGLESSYFCWTRSFLIA